MRAQLVVFRDDSTTHTVSLDSEQLEWITNSLRLMQEKQQELATRNYGKTITKQDVVDALNTAGDLGKGREWETPDGEASVDMGEFFLESFQDVTTLRESIVEAIGRDLTDG